MRLDDVAGQDVKAVGSSVSLRGEVLRHLALTLIVKPKDAVY